MTRPRDEAPDPKPTDSSPVDDALLRRAFARGGETPDSARVLLDEHESESGTWPVLKPLPAGARPRPATRSRFQVQGEIARGGMGVVLKAHDPDLGRDVAIKVLRDELSAAPDALQRFVEEAQIGGQLQHPGVVPVYEIGLMADDRPYFAMKLVKGATFAQILAERESPLADRRRALDVLLDVARTVAYAHSRSVVHRDLKPANVMVGRFGEVQVMDWGLAKVLRGAGGSTPGRPDSAGVSVIETVRSPKNAPGSDSLAGSVRGTPSYMSPEQASGRVEAIDARADVFSLGAVLCEILTGAPPYPGDRGDALVLAIDGRLDAAFARLDASGADPELIGLARRCLAPAKAERPKDAGAVAAALARHLDAAEERTRRAEIEATEAEARATEERKKKKLVVALGAAALIALGGTSAALLASAAKRQRDGAETASAVQPLLDRAARSRGRAARDEDPDAYAESLAILERASALVAGREASETLRGDVAAVLGEVRREAALCGEKRARADDDRALATLIEELRRPESASPTPEERDALARAVAEALRERGLDPLAAGDPTAEKALAVEIGASAVREEILTALSVWADAADAGTAARLRRVADLAEPDPVRREIRSAAARRDAEALARIADSVVADAAPAATLAALLAGLTAAGDADRAARLAVEATRARPGHFGIRMASARALLAAEPPHVAEALDDFAAALALRPASVEVRHEMARSLEDGSDPAAALALYEDAVRLRPGDAHLAEHRERARRALEAK